MFNHWLSWTHLKVDYYHQICFLSCTFIGASKRMENLALRSSITQAKIMGTIVSISGALVVVLYKGPLIISAPSQSQSQSPSLHSLRDTSEKNWVIGGLLLTTDNLLFSMWYIVQVLCKEIFEFSVAVILRYVANLWDKNFREAKFDLYGILQTQTMKIYPAELVLVFLYLLCATIIAAPVCLIAEGNLSAWRLKPDIALVAVIYSVRNVANTKWQNGLLIIYLTNFILSDQGFFGSSFSSVVHTWGLHLKGPVYVSIFKPLSIVIAAAMGVLFLGEALYLGRYIILYLCHENAHELPFLLQTRTSATTCVSYHDIFFHNSLALFSS